MPNAYIAYDPHPNDSHAWFCSERCANEALGEHEGHPEETAIEGLACENEGCPVDDLG